MRQDILDLRFATTRELEKVIASLGLATAERGRDERGHRIVSYTANERVAALHERFAAPGTLPPVQTPVAEKPARAPRSEGVTAQVRAWVVANPRATKADAVAQFPHVNRSTVSVQYGHARRDGR